MEKGIYFLKFYSTHKDDKYNLLTTGKTCNKLIHLSHIFLFENNKKSWENK